MKMISLVKTEKTKLEGIERELPVFAVGETHHLIMGGGIQGKWSGSLYPPMIGDRVTVNFNGFGAGTVVDHFVQDGWLGLEVKVDKQPDWHIKQGGHNPIKVFGAEVIY